MSPEDKWLYKIAFIIIIIIIIIIIWLHFHGIDVTNGQLSNLCLPSNCFSRSRIEDVSDSLSITVFLSFLSLFFTLYRVVSG